MTERAEQLERGPTAPASRRRRWLLVSLLLAGGMLAYLAVWLLGTDTGTQRQRLPDGSTVSLLGYTYGQKHEFITGVRWQKLLWPILPLRWRSHLNGVTLLYRQESPPKSLVLWIRQRPWDPNLIVRRMVTAVDEQGCELNAEGPDSYGIDGSGVEPALPLPLDIFSRHGTTVRARLYVKSGSGGWNRGADFTVPNPDYGPHPVWKATPLPVRQVVDGLTFTLRRFDTYVRRDLKPGPLLPGEYPCSRITYDVSRNGKPLPNWFIWGLALADADGNRWKPGLTTFNTSGNVKRYEFHGAVCPDEPYRVRAELTNLQEFAAGDRWVVRNLPVPARGLVRDPHITTQRGPVRVSISQVCGPHSQLAGIDSHFDRAEALVQVVIKPKELANERVQLLRATDQLGRNLMLENMASVLQGDGPGGDGSQIVFALRPLPGVRSVNLTFGIRRSYFVVFIARPIPADGVRTGR